MAGVYPVSRLYFSLLENTGSTRYIPVRSDRNEQNQEAAHLGRDRVSGGGGGSLEVANNGTQKAGFKVHGRKSWRCSPDGSALA